MQYQGINWAPQEIGFIVSRPKVKVSPMALDETIAFGFISNIQSRRIYEEEVTGDFLLPALIHGFRVRLRAPFELAKPEGTPPPYFAELTPAEAKVLAENCVKNSQIWDAVRCRDNYIPEFIRTQGKNIGAENRRALQYQIANHDWYRPKRQE